MTVAPRALGSDLKLYLTDTSVFAGYARELRCTYISSWTCHCVGSMLVLGCEESITLTVWELSLSLLVDWISKMHTYCILQRGMIIEVGTFVERIREYD
jgi:hypothetical protein